MAERFQDTDTQKKFRTSTPKGSKFAAGYVDRAKIRTGQNEDTDADDRAARLEALEALYKKDEVDRATYEKIRFEIAGGDLSSTHLVKGLDFKLLARVRQGEDVFGETEKRDEDEDPAPTAAGGAKAEDDVDDEFERLEASDVRAVEREKSRKKGQLSLVPGQKRTRDQILAEMKAAREAARLQAATAAAAEPVLGSRFRKIGAKQAAGSRIERDSRGREVLVIVDEDGHEKRKVRKTMAKDDNRDRAGDDVNDAKLAQGIKVLGMEVPEFYRKKIEAEAAAAAAKPVSIFEDAGSDYDPLAGMGSDSSDSDSDSDSGKEKKRASKGRGKELSQSSAKPGRRSQSDSPSDREDGEASDASVSSRGSNASRRRRRRSPPPTKQPAEAAAPTRRNYFGNATLMSEEMSLSEPSVNDASVLAALRKAKQMREASMSEAKSKEAEREARLKKLLQSNDRDAEDLDMGFGSSRLEDDEDMDDAGERIKLSTWRGKGGGGSDDEGDGRGGSHGGKAKRKRGGKKRKGDGNNVADVLRVLERRRETGGS